MCSSILYRAVQNLNLVLLGTELQSQLFTFDYVFKSPLKNENLNLSAEALTTSWV